MVNTDFKRNKKVAQENVMKVRIANLENNPEITLGRYKAYVEIHGEDKFIKNERIKYEESLIRKSLELKTLTVEQSYEAYQGHAKRIGADQNLLNDIIKYEKDNLSDLFMNARNEKDFIEIDKAIENYIDRHKIVDEWIKELHRRCKKLYEKSK